ncbi:MAG: hypothetical protein V7727_21260 [Sneathiella sp.]
MSSKKSTLQKLRDRLLSKFPEYPCTINRVDPETGETLEDAILALWKRLKEADLGVKFDIAITNTVELSENTEDEKAVVSLDVNGIGKRPFVEIRTLANFDSAANQLSYFEGSVEGEFRTQLEIWHSECVAALKKTGRPYTQEFVKININDKYHYICEEDELRIFNAGWLEITPEGSLACCKFVSEYFGESIIDYSVLQTTLASEAYEFAIGSLENLVYRRMNLLNELVTSPIDDRNSHKVYELGRVFELHKERFFEISRVKNRTTSSGAASNMKKNARIEALLSGVEGELANSNRSHFTENLFDAFAWDVLEISRSTNPNLWKQGANQFDNYLSEIKSKEPWRCRYLAILGKSA